MQGKQSPTATIKERWIEDPFQIYSPRYTPTEWCCGTCVPYTDVTYKGYDELQRY